MSITFTSKKARSLTKDSTVGGPMQGPSNLCCAQTISWRKQVRIRCPRIRRRSRPGALSWSAERSEIGPLVSAGTATTHSRKPGSIASGFKVSAGMPDRLESLVTFSVLQVHRALHEHQHQRTKERGVAEVSL